MLSELPTDVNEGFQSNSDNMLNLVPPMDPSDLSLFKISGQRCKSAKGSIGISWSNLNSKGRGRLLLDSSSKTSNPPAKVEEKPKICFNF